LEYFKQTICKHHKVKYYWERRSPVDPDSPERFMAEGIEDAFRPDF
jgi:hypothetical protein